MKASGTNSFRCPHCAELTVARVMDSRPRDNFVRRRRKCGTCGGRFRTLEIPEADVERLMALAQPQSQFLPNLEVLAQAVTGMIERIKGGPNG